MISAKSIYNPGNNNYRFVAERTNADSSPLPQALLNVMDAIKKWHPAIQDHYLGDAGPFENISPEKMQDYLETIESAWNNNIAAVCRIELISPEFSINLFFNYEDTIKEQIEYCWFSFPPNLPEDKSSLQQIGNLIAEAATGFGAYNAFIEDEDLLMLYRGKRGAMKAMENLPEELKQYVPKPQEPDIPVRDLPPLLMPQEFDRRKVPTAVWSINYWDDKQVRTIGREKISAAGFAQINELPDGALVLLALEEFINVKEPEHLEKLTDIIQKLSLPESQNTYRFKHG